MQVVYGGDKAKELLKEGLDRLCDVVEVTLGPKGRNVIIDKPFGQPVITNDGATIIQNFEISTEDKQLSSSLNVSIKIMKDIAKKLNILAGDGRTTATILARSILHECIRNITAGADPITLRRGLEKSLPILIKELDKLRREIKNDDLEHVATISSNSKEYGKIIADVLKEVTADGVVTTELSNVQGVVKDVTNGMKIDRGFISPDMINNNKLQAYCEDYPVLLTDIEINHIGQLAPLLSKLKGKTNGLIIIADDVSGEALESLAQGRKLGFYTLAIKAPGINKNKIDILDDISYLIGGTVFKKGIDNLDDATYEDLGQARKIVSTDSGTVIIGDGDVTERVKELKLQLKDVDESEKESLKKRIAKLIGGIAVLKIGGLTFVEQVEKQRRIEDALSATKAAMTDGVLPGGGISLFRVSEALSETKLTGDEQLAVNILKDSLEAPIRQIALNSGISGDIVIDNIRRYKLPDKDYGYNFETGENGGMFRMGIIDPYIVTKTILEVVISGIASLITVEKMIVNITEAKEES